MFAQQDASLMLDLYPPALMPTVKLVGMLAFAGMLSAYVWAIAQGPHAWWWFVPVCFLVSSLLATLLFRRLVYMGSPWIVLLLCVPQAVIGTTLWLPLDGSAA